MAILGTLLKKGIKIRESLEQEYASHYELQKHELRKLLISAAETSFGSYYHFKGVLRNFKSPGSHDFYKAFTQEIPIHDYDKIYQEWWSKSKWGTKDICWPGKVKYFALSSGTSGASSKHIPVTKEMIKSVQKTSIRQILTLSKYDLPDKLFDSGILMLGGSTHLNDRGSFFEGDLSGITASQLPFWFQHFYKPGQKIAKTRDWNDKLEKITRTAREWDIGVVVGVPAWIQILIERIIDYYKVNTIHDIWPNLTIFVHGGVSFDPYRKGFEKLLGRPIYYIETYLASEGFIAFQALPNRRSMRMVLNNGIFYEFIPFNEANFDWEGNLLPGAETLTIDQVEEEREYALLLSTNAGSWRYLIGDVIKFLSKRDLEIIITGRTKHFLSLCGEHLSLENMNKAIEMTSDKLNIRIKEFTVSGVPYQNLFAHHWYIGSDDTVNSEELKYCLDEQLKKLNDDYRVERKAALKEIIVDVLPPQIFYKWMAILGKEGGQNKFPRVLNKTKYLDWRRYLETEQATSS